jgi:membrane protease YdiL (CAAX protease family)
MLAWVKLILTFAMQITPGLLLTFGLLTSLPKKCVELRITLFIVGFVLIRDTMTPFGLWRIGSSNGVLWLEFIESPEILMILAFGSIILVVIFRMMDPSIFDLVIFKKRGVMDSLVVGFAGAVLLCGTILMMRVLVSSDNGMFDSSSSSSSSSTWDRSNIVLKFSILNVCLMGNFMEEVLFRGFLQGHLETIDGIGDKRAALFSGVAFSVFHVFLANSVTQLGNPLLFFTLLEGTVCAMIRLRGGVIASTITHGLTIFAIATGFV